MFSGALRDVKNKANQTARDILELNQSVLSDDDLKKMRYILTEPTGIRILQMTRPIEKVERRSNLQTGVLIWDIFNILFHSDGNISARSSCPKSRCLPYS